MGVLNREFWSPLWRKESTERAYDEDMDVYRVFDVDVWEHRQTGERRMTKGRDRIMPAPSADIQDGMLRSYREMLGTLVPEEEARHVERVLAEYAEEVDEFRGELAAYVEEIDDLL